MIKVLGKRVLVKRHEKEETTKGGLIIPEKLQDDQQYGEVIAVGKEVTDLKVGQKVMFGKFTGMEIEVERVKYTLFNESDIFGILE